MKKLQLCALMSFMLCMSYSALFVQENKSKDQERSSWTKVCTLKRPPLA